LQGRFGAAKMTVFERRSGVYILAHEQRSAQNCHLQPAGTVLGQVLMGDVVNLRHFRKQKSRGDKSRSADENRTRHGETKAARTLREAEADSNIRKLDAHRRERPEDKPDEPA
jgi:hypothetical protein